MGAVLNYTLEAKMFNGKFFYFKRRTIMAKYGCVVCGWTYDEDMGDDDLGIPAGTPFEELPEDFECPLCGVGIDQFEKVE